MTERTTQEYRPIDFLTNNGGYTFVEIVERMRDILKDMVPTEYHPVAKFIIESDSYGDCFDNLTWGRPETEKERNAWEKRFSANAANNDARNRAEYERLKKLFGDA